MESTKNNLMVLDLDLTFDYINIETMIDLSQKQDVMQGFILTYCSLIETISPIYPLECYMFFEAYKYLFSIII